MPSVHQRAGSFDDLVQANAEYVELFEPSLRSGRAERGLAIITCMDSRVDPFAIVGMDLGDVKILRNTAARVTPDVLRGLVIATHLLGVNRILLMPHTDCRMAQTTDEQLHADIRTAGGPDTRAMDLGSTSDQLAALEHDLAKIRTHPFLPEGLPVIGGMYDVDTGRLHLLDA